MTLFEHAKRIPEAALVGSVFGFGVLALVMGVGQIIQNDVGLLGLLETIGGYLALSLFGTLLAFPVCMVGLALVALPTTFLFPQRYWAAVVFLTAVGAVAGSVVGHFLPFLENADVGGIWGATSMFAWALKLPLPENGLGHA